MDVKPTQENISLILKKLINDEIDRGEVALWAQKFYLDDNFLTTEEATEIALERLSSIDLTSTDRPYLYTADDFKAWLDEMK